MKTVSHHSFTLWAHSIDDEDSKIPVMEFEEGYSYDEILLTMLSLDEIGIICSLTCETWSTVEDDRPVLDDDIKSAMEMLDND